MLTIQLLVLLFASVGCLHAFHPSLKDMVKTAGRERIPPSGRQRIAPNGVIVALYEQLRNDDEAAEDDEKAARAPKKVADDADSMEQNDQAVMNRLLMPYRMSEALSTAVTQSFIFFIVMGFLLQSLGYAYIVDDGQFRIGTIEDRQFRDEIVRDIKRGN